jgi:hypothetical protein
MDAGGKVDEVAGQENKNEVHASVGWVYRVIVDCAVGWWEE